MEDIIHSILRTGASFFILMITTLWLGKQVNSRNNHFNFALSITIGSFIANMGFDININFIPMTAAFLTLVFIYFLFSFISFKSRRFRLWISGKSTVIIENGKILDANMRKLRYSLDDLNQQLREMGIFNIFEVEYALFEVSGNLSVLKKAKFQNTFKGDFNTINLNHDIKLPLELIMNGVVIEKNLNDNYSMLWLNQQLSLRSMQIKDIHYAVISTDGSLFIDLYHDCIKSPIDKE